MQMLLSIIWLEMETICSQIIAQEATIGAIKIQVEDLLSGHKVLLTRTGQLLTVDQVWNCLQYLMVLMTFIVLDL